MNAMVSWRHFVRLSLWCAILPGLGFATGMAGLWMWHEAPPLLYTALVQTHAFALLIGWGGTMILGVALHFLPRLRGTSLLFPQTISILFWLLVLGLSMRLLMQPLLAMVDLANVHGLTLWLNGLLVAGLFLQAFALLGLIGVLFLSFRKGRPLKKGHGFLQVVPLLGVFAISALLAQVLWCWGAGDLLFNGQILVFFPIRSQIAAVDIMLFGCVAAIGIAMSSRLFPLTFRMQLAHIRGLKITAIFLGIGVVLTTINALGFQSNFLWIACYHLANIAFALGLFIGIFSVRIFHKRKAIKSTQIPYRIWEDPAGVGVLTAYLWMFIAAIGLLLLPWQSLILDIPIVPKILARHAMGLGFMTLLIISVGWKMLPGFAGGRPKCRSLIWLAILLTNLAVTLRLLPILAPAWDWSGQNSAHTMLPIAGVFALVAIGLFAYALRSSFQKEPL